MIDRLVLRCWFSPGYPSLETLGVRLQGEIEDGIVSSLRHPWESIPSSFSRLAFKIIYDPQFGIEPPPDHGPFQTRLSLGDVPKAAAWRPYIELNASPAKLMQGHNVFGSDDLETCALALAEAFFYAYPQVADYLDQRSWEVVEADVTYHSFGRNQREAELFIQALSRVHAGQTKNRTGYASTAYFGKKNSRLRKLKVYAKQPELQQQLDSIRDPQKKAKLQRIVTDDLIRYTDGMIRWEATVKKRWFERRGMNTSLFKMVKNFDAKAIWQECFGDLMKVMEGGKVVIIDDEKIEAQLKEAYGVQSMTRNGEPKFTKSGKPIMRYTKAYAAYRVYRAIRLEGWEEAKRTTAKKTFYRNLNFLTEATGVSVAQLQQMTGEGGSNVIPFFRFIQVDFGAQYPSWVEAA